MTTFLSLLLSMLTALLTFKLAKRESFGSIRASCLVSLLGVALLQLNSFEHSFFSSLIFGASFVGMSSPKVFNNIHISLSSLIFGLTYLWVTPLLVGHGGSLGLSAFLSCFFVLAAHKTVSSLLHKKMI